MMQVSKTGTEPETQRRPEASSNPNREAELDQRILAVHDNVLLFERADTNETFLIALNFGPSSQQLAELIGYDPILSTHMDRVGTGAGLLRADEGLILKRR